LALQRFVDWAGGVGPNEAKAYSPPTHEAVRSLSVLFTPWGEALHRARYRKALRALALMPHVEFVGIQTNLSVAPTWASELPATALAKVGLWATWHPTETSLRSFITRVQRALDLGVGLSIGVVATKEHLGHVDDLANALLEIGTSLQWINAYKRGYRTPKDYYSSAELARLTELDPWFPNDLLGERSAGRPCDTGTSTISVDGDGEVTRCHFTKRRLGNLYVDNLNKILAPEGTNNPCPRLECNCFQGYVHLTDTSLHDTFRSTAALSRRPVR
jgi:hypothetical protein